MHWSELCHNAKSLLRMVFKAAILDEPSMGVRVAREVKKSKGGAQGQPHLEVKKRKTSKI